MSDKNKNLFSDDVLKDLESLKSRYSDYGTDDEPIRKTVKHTEQPKVNRDAAKPDFSGVKEIKREPRPAAEKAASASVKKAPPVRKNISANNAAPAGKATPANRPAPRHAAAADNDLSVFDGLILTDNGSSMYENRDSAEASNRRVADNKRTAGLPKADELTKEANKSKNQKKKKSKKIRNILLIVFIAAVLWGTLFGIDLVFASHWQDPIFCKKTAEYENGSKDFLGVFYKVQYHVEDNGDIYTVCLPWFVKGPNKDLKEAAENAVKADGTSTTEIPTMPQADNTPIEIVIPKEYVDIESGITKDSELTAEQKANGYISVTLNSDGSVTYQIGKADYEREITNIKSDVENKLKGLAEDTEFPSIKKVDFTDDFSKVSLYVDKAVYLTGLDSFVNQSVYTWVGFYQSFAQQSLVCDLSVLDYTDGSVIEQSKG